MPQQDDPVAGRRPGGELRTLPSEDVPGCQQAGALPRVGAHLRRDRAGGLHLRRQGFEARYDSCNLYLSNILAQSTFD